MQFFHIASRLNSLNISFSSISFSMFSCSFLPFSVVIVAFLTSLPCSADENQKTLDYQLESDPNISKELSFGGIEMKLFTVDSLNINNSLINHSSEKPPSFRPEISLFVSSKPSQSLSFNPGHISQNITAQEHNRYKDTIPAVFRLTLKGYSIVEYSNYRTNTWSLDKVKSDVFRKPEIMFSVTKNF